MMTTPSSKSSGASVPTGKYWATKWQNETDPAKKASLDRIYGFSKKYPTGYNSGNQNIMPVGTATPMPLPGRATSSPTKYTPTPMPEAPPASPLPSTQPSGGLSPDALTNVANQVGMTTTGSPNPPLFDYKVPGHGKTTQAIKDTAGTTWYKTQGGQWRNTATNAVSRDMPSWQAPAAAPAPAAPATPVAATPTAATPAAPEPVPTFKSVRDFVGANDSTFSPAVSYKDFPAQLGPETAYDQSLFDWQKDQGLKELRAKMSADGLSGSGAEMEFQNRLMAQLGAQEADRRQQMIESGRNRALQGWQTAAGSANQAADRQAGAAEADINRYENQRQLEAERQFREGTTKWGRTLDVLDRILAMDPMRYGYNATTANAETYKSLGDILAQLEAGQGGGGGGGGGGGARVAPTAPPDYAGPATSYANTQDWVGLATNLLGQLL